MNIESVEDHKREMRSSLKRRRNGLSPARRARGDALIARRLLALQEFRAADVVLTYLSFGSEVDTRRIISAAWDTNKIVAIPRCVPGARHMRWYRINALEGLERSTFGVEEPPLIQENEQSLNTGERMLAIVPALTFDYAGYRLGYGGGYYDTFLAGFTGASVGICLEELMSDDLRGAGVVASHDLPVQLVVTG